MELTWHGHSTWYITVGDTTLLIDPFFANPHTTVEPSDVATPDYVLLTHGHQDHIADAAEFSEATLVTTPELAGYATEQMGFTSTIAGGGMNYGGTVACGDAFVTMVRADHTNGIMTEYDRSGGPPGGFVISDGKPGQTSAENTSTFYHAGDTSLMVEMREVIGPYLTPDAAAVPIGDHFTMGPAQAAIAVEWLDVEYAFPMHYDTFPPIEAETEDFIRETKATGSDAEIVVLAGDESFSLN
jgi:L-ascorbate metabolism protein UlaG (beta-lactamase superfamily)